MDDLIHEDDLIPGKFYKFYPCGNNLHFHTTVSGATECKKRMMRDDSFPKNQKPLTKMTSRKIEFNIIKGGNNEHD